MVNAGMAQAPVDVQAKVKKLFAEIGVVATSKKLGVSRESILRIMGGLDIRNGTLALIQKVIADERL